MYLRSITGSHYKEGAGDAYPLSPCSRGICKWSVFFCPLIFHVCAGGAHHPVPHVLEGRPSTTTYGETEGEHTERREYPAGIMSGDPMTAPVGPAQETSKTPESAGILHTAVLVCWCVSGCVSILSHWKHHTARGTLLMRGPSSYAHASARPNQSPRADWFRLVHRGRVRRPLCGMIDACFFLGF